MRVARFERRKAAAMAVLHREAEASPDKVSPRDWTHFFHMNKEALDDELRRVTAELTRRLALALRDGDLNAARAIWSDGELASQIDVVLRRD